jgi:hypothetical protein
MICRNWQSPLELFRWDFGTARGKHLNIRQQIGFVLQKNVYDYKSYDVFVRS